MSTQSSATIRYSLLSNQEPEVVIENNSSFSSTVIVTSNDDDNVRTSSKSTVWFFTCLSLKGILYFLFVWSLMILLLYYNNILNNFDFSKNYLINYLGIFQNYNVSSTSCEPLLLFTLNQSSDRPLFLIDGVFYPQASVVQPFKNRSINFECLNKNNKMKRIFAWTKFFSDETFAYGLGAREPFIKRNCPATNCELTNQMNLLNSSHLVLVHMRDSIRRIPSYRPNFQRWVFVLYESPVHSVDYIQYNGLFNLTSTYRKDSDFNGFYETDSLLNWELNEHFDENRNYLEGKSEFAAIVVSNCGANNRRLDYVKELQKSVKVDVFGKCGKPCPISFKNGSPGSCKDIIGKDYNFYFAFENSNCFDYITEKFFTILKYDIIPVVLGGGDYDYYIPKSGFINVLDYKNAQQLADYLIYLSKNQTAYNSYFKWKKYAKFNGRQLSFNPICDMCIKLNLEEFYPNNLESKIIYDIGNYWNKSLHCKVPDLGLS